jgi:uncharacterized protein HemX
MNDDLVKMGGSAVGGAALVAAALRLFPSVLAFLQQGRELGASRDARTEERLWARIVALETQLDADRDDCNRRLAEMQARLDTLTRQDHYRAIDVARVLAEHERMTGQPFPRLAPETDA